MLIQNISKRNYELLIDGKQITVTPSETLDVDEELGLDLTTNYPPTEWKALEIVKLKEEKKDLQTEAKPVKSKSSKR